MLLVVGGLSKVNGLAHPVVDGSLLPLKGRLPSRQGTSLRADLNSTRRVARPACVADPRALVDGAGSETLG